MVMANAAEEAISHLLSTKQGFTVGLGKSKGVAFDGTNFLVGLQLANSNVAAQPITSSGELGGPRIDLAPSGSPPLVAFNGTNYLLVWADFSDLPSDIVGQFVSRSGEKVGSSFLIQADVDTAEVGGIDFDGTNFFMVWAANSLSQSVPSTIQAQFVSSDGNILSTPFQVNSSPEDHQYPVVAFDGTNHFVCWQEQVSGTNLWNVGGRLVSREGQLLEEMLISEHPASGLYPIGVAFGKTNYLVAWSREVGPFLNREYFYTPYFTWAYYTNLWYPMIHARLVSLTGSPQGPEFPIARGEWRQTAPGVAFDGTNYVVSWIDARYGVVLSPGNSYAYWAAFCQKLDASGQAHEPPWVYQRQFLLLDKRNHMTHADALASYPSNLGPTLIFASNRFLAIYYWPAFSFYLTSTLGVFLIEDRQIAPALQNFRAARDGSFRADLLGDINRTYSIEVSTNFVDWTLLPGVFGSYPPYPGTTLELPKAAQGAGRTFYRAVGGRLACLANLRRIRQAKDEWGLDNARWPEDWPMDTELFGPGKYMTAKPRCPMGGDYTIDIIRNIPTCSLGTIDGHTL